MPMEKGSIIMKIQAVLIDGFKNLGSKINVGVDDFKIDHLSQYFSFIIKRKKPPSASRQTNH